MSDKTEGFKVAIVGAAGGIGQPLSLLLKLCPGISELTLYDIVNSRVPVKGVAADLSHINTSCCVSGYAGDAEIEAALTGSDIVVMLAGGMTLTPGMTRECLFDSSAGLVRSLAENCRRFCPNAFVAIVTNPVNSMVPIFVGMFPESAPRVFGVTTLDVVRASTFVSAAMGISDPLKVHVPVIGGHGGESILALVSQTEPFGVVSDPESLEKRVTNAAFEVLELKKSTSTLSMAYAAAEFVKTLLSAKAKHTVFDYAYVKHGETYFAGKCTINENGCVGMAEIPVDKLTPYEQKRFEQVCTKCKADVELANQYLKRVQQAI